MDHIRQHPKVLAGTPFSFLVLPLEAVLVGVPALLLLAVGAIEPWWHLLQEPQPTCVLAFRLLTLPAIVGIAFILFSRKGNASRLGFVSLFIILIPLGCLFYIVLYDPRSLYLSLAYSREAGRLWTSISSNFLTPQIPWFNFEPVTSMPKVSDQYTVLDGIEATANFLKAGWYLTLAGGIAAFATALAWDWHLVLKTFNTYKRYFLAAALVTAVAVAAPSVAAYSLWQQGRASYADGNYAGSLADYSDAMRWNRALSYDSDYRFELGVLYGRLGDIQNSDYWASQADILINSQEYDLALSIYRDHVVSLNEDPTLRFRYSYLLLCCGSEDYCANRTGMALDKWSRALALNPDDIETLYDLGMAYAQTHDYSQAITMFKRVITLNEDVGLYRYKFFASTTFYRKPITAESWSRMGWCYYNLGELAAANQCWANSKQQGPTDVTGVP